MESGGLGLSRMEWERRYGITVGELADFASYQDGAYRVLFVNDMVATIWRVWGEVDHVALDAAQREVRELIPADSQAVSTFEPQGNRFAELYLSESLKTRFPDDYPWAGGERGNFLALYSVYDDRVQAVMIAPGNNP